MRAACRSEDVWGNSQLELTCWASSRHCFHLASKPRPAQELGGSQLVRKPQRAYTQPRAELAPEAWPSPSSSGALETWATSSALLHRTPGSVEASMRPDMCPGTALDGSSAADRQPRVLMAAAEACDAPGRTTCRACRRSPGWWQPWIRRYAGATGSPQTPWPSCSPPRLSCAPSLPPCGSTSRQRARCVQWGCTQAHAQGKHVTCLP